MSHIIPGPRKWGRCIAFACGIGVVWPTHAASISVSGTPLGQQAGSITCSYSQASEDVQGAWSFTCGTGSATVTISPAVNGSVCEAYGAMSEDVNGNWTITGCVSAAPMVSLDAPVQTSSTYPSNVPFTLKATATAPAGREINSVEFFHDGVSIHAGVLSGSQYTWDWAPTSGAYQVTVRATDNTGALTETSPAVQMIFAPTVGPATIYYIHPDHLGTPREITRASDNQIVWRWDNTEAFGDSQPDENPSGLGIFEYNLRFPGQYYDVETGTNYNYFRDYDPSIGRYVESDPIGLRGGINTYTYLKSAPLVGKDPFDLIKATLTFGGSFSFGEWGGGRESGIGIDDQGHICAVAVKCHNDVTIGFLGGLGGSIGLEKGDYCTGWSTSSANQIAVDLGLPAVGGVSMSFEGSETLPSGGGKIFGLLGVGAGASNSTCETHTRCWSLNPFDD